MRRRESGILFSFRGFAIFVQCEFEKKFITKIKIRSLLHNVNAKKFNFDTDPGLLTQCDRDPKYWIFDGALLFNVNSNAHEKKKHL
jgi:hypothetical protein